MQAMNVILDMPCEHCKHATERSELPKYLKMNKQVAKERDLLMINHYRNWERYLKRKGRDTYLKIVTDGVHPNLEGYRLILLPELKRVLK